MGQSCSTPTLPKDLWCRIAIEVARAQRGEDKARFHAVVARTMALRLVCKAAASALGSASSGALWRFLAEVRIKDVDAKASEVSVAWQPFVIAHVQYSKEEMAAEVAQTEFKKNNNRRRCSITFMVPPVHPGGDTEMVPLSASTKERIARDAEAMLLLGRWAAVVDRDKALQRYRGYLALQLERPDELLIPSLDIAIVATCHILHTARYDQEAPLVATRLTLPPLLAPCFSAALDRTAALWQARFGVPYMEGPIRQWPLFNVQHRTWSYVFSSPKVLDVPAWAEPEVTHDETTGRAPRSLLAAAAAERLAVPLADKGAACSLDKGDVDAHCQWLIDLPEELNRHSQFTRNMDEKLVDRAMGSYQRMLVLASRRLEGLEPTSLIDWLWHAHQMDRHLYRAECLAATGTIIHHEPGRAGNLEATAAAWKAAFNSEMAEDHKFDPPHRN